MKQAVTPVDWLAGVKPLAPASIDFLYADPPFNTGAAKRTPPNAHKRSLVPHAPCLVPSSYRDSWPTIPHYIAWLRERLAATLPTLKPTGVIVIHCDYRTSHHIRILLDELLGDDHFVNHLIWHYGLGGSSPRRFARKHDDILVYAIDPDRYYFEPPMVPATSNRLKGKLKKATDVVRVPLDAMIDIPSLNNMASERTGYPTQKPLALLDLLIRAFCPQGGTVLDPCCGSGTTLVAAISAGRNAIGFDISKNAIKVTNQRLYSLVES
ncbi:MAG: site-specific DNA-methyltransferase [Phycisphaerales bacterium]